MTIETKDREFFHAVKNGKLDRVKELIDQEGANVNARDDEGATPLHWAGRFGDEAIAELLIKNNADVRAETKGGSTPLHWASHPHDEVTDKAALDVVTLLVENGADVRARTKKEKDYSTPLHSAALAGRKEVAEFLISKGADVNAHTSRRAGNRNPLHYAAMRGDKGIVELLIDQGAYSFRNSLGETPEDIARRLGHSDVAAILAEMPVGPHGRRAFANRFGNADSNAR
jgi:ankyrin repeat protein